MWAVLVPPNCCHARSPGPQQHLLLLTPREETSALLPLRCARARLPFFIVAYSQLFVLKTYPFLQTFPALLASPTQLSLYLGRALSCCWMSKTTCPQAHSIVRGRRGRQGPQTPPRPGVANSSGPGASWEVPEGSPLGKGAGSRRPGQRGPGSLVQLNQDTLLLSASCDFLWKQTSSDQTKKRHHFYLPPSFIDKKTPNCITENLSFLPPSLPLPSLLPFHPFLFLPSFSLPCFSPFNRVLAHGPQTRNLIRVLSLQLARVATSGRCHSQSAWSDVGNFCIAPQEGHCFPFPPCFCIPRCWLTNRQ